MSITPLWVVGFCWGNCNGVPLTSSKLLLRGLTVNQLPIEFKEAKLVVKIPFDKRVEL